MKRRAPLPGLPRIREIEAELRTVAAGGPPALPTVIPALATLLGSDKMFAYSLRQRGEGLGVEHGVVSGLPDQVLSRFDAFLDGNAVGWGGYNPIRPEPEQRNKALDSPRIARAMGIRDWREVPGSSSLYPLLGFGGHHTLRALVCDGPSLLTWIGGLRREPFDETERRTLQRLVPALRRRLLIERLLSAGGATRSMFDAAFAAIPSPAFITEAGGALREANPAGLVLLERDGQAIRAALQLAVRSGEATRFQVTRIVAPGMPEMRLLVLRPGAEPDAPGRAAAAAARWSFTRRQTQVLALLVEGSTNRTIAAQLGVAERTVEVHLTAMFDKAQVESRAALVAATLGR